MLLKTQWKKRQYSILILLSFFSVCKLELPRVLGRLNCVGVEGGLVLMFKMCCIDMYIFISRFVHHKFFFTCKVGLITVVNTLLVFPLPERIPNQYLGKRNGGLLVTLLFLQDCSATYRSPYAYHHLTSCALNKHYMLIAQRRNEQI